MSESKSKLKVLDLFSGILAGGFSLGLERTGGFETVAFCEIEEFPRRVLAKHWPKVPQYHDVRTLTKDVLDRDGIAVDVICGGFPCQDISLAGPGGGLSGERSGLYSEVVRLVGEIGPQIVLLENVSELLGRGLGTVLSTLAAFGYCVQWHCIQAARVGARHIRDRIWIIAHSSSDGLERAIQIANSIKANVVDDWRPLARASFADNPEGWASESTVLGKDDDVPNWLDRIKGCGNAVVPQIPELIGRAILAARAA